MPSSSSSFRECAIWAMALKSVALCRAKSDKWWSFHLLLAWPTTVFLGFLDHPFAHPFRSRDICGHGLETGVAFLMQRIPCAVAL
jgi:hypothetical protein